MSLPARGYLFIGLNIVRILSIISLLLVFASSIVTMVQDIRAVNTFISDGKQESSSNSTDCGDDTDYIFNSTVPNQPAGAFWAVVNRLLIIAQVIVLLFSEIGWPAKFFARFFPVLGDDFGLGALGLIQCLLGAAVLSHHVDPLSLVSAFFLFSIGCLNMLLGLIFRESAKEKRELTAWRTRYEDPRAPPLQTVHDLKQKPIFLARGLSERTTVAPWEGQDAKYGADEFGRVPERSGSSASARHGMGFGRQGEKAALARGYTVSRPEESLPAYASRPVSNPSQRPVSAASHDSRVSYASQDRPRSAASHEESGSDTAV
ncbi:hypothetical protein CERSUDRAFT_116610 [Gelatoporia subvermispora B]|uniref:DUF7598 domain-containing protein n=1 Tax=Ceriporiopsis subvermispora (strain B) TaxID=914234 RepID=M2QSW8_CERS8|nr:hypothetical protein CERSUDRAFT_116610 [Gelatoporia subvermispora B]